MGSTEPLEQTDRTRLRRLKERGSFDRALAESILDEALVAHVGTVTERGPIVLPMAHARVDDRLYVHGAPGNAILRALAGGAEACVTVTLLDGLVLVDLDQVNERTLSRYMGAVAAQLFLKTTGINNERAAAGNPRAA